MRVGHGGRVAVGLRVGVGVRNMVRAGGDVGVAVADSVGGHPRLDGGGDAGWRGCNGRTGGGGCDWFDRVVGHSAQALMNMWRKDTPRYSGACAGVSGCVVTVALRTLLLVGGQFH